MRSTVQWLAACSVLFLFGCSTDVELNAPYEETTIVYGLINQTEGVHVVKINKSFLGTGSAFDYVTVPDSSQYSNVSARVEEVIGNSVTRCWDLRDTLIVDKETGLFFNTEVIAYYFNPTDASFLSNSCGGSVGALDEDATYRLVASLNEGSKEVRAETELVRDFSLDPPFSVQPEVSMAFTNSSEFNNYPSTTVDWNASPFSRRYEVALNFSWIEWYGPNDSLSKSLTWKVATLITDDFEGGQKLSATIDGEQFYSFLANNIPVDPNVTKRIAQPFNVVFTVAGEDLHTYMEVNEPVNGVVQERPAFTNIENGIGIFSSRYEKVVQKPLNKNSLKELAEGQYTASLLFCSDNPAHQLESWYCP